MLNSLAKSTSPLVKGFNEWKKQGRFVKKGAKEIKVIAPLIGKNTEKEKKVLYGFRYVNVFDVSNTDGKEFQPQL
ncbi:ArdC-like ssDNA-binding domain-containing protein [Rossellomorea yichunensis]|uniref:ArdC-like ssDNA-binding domain-containing protein n=1 Tax=Rossellomorea yichunensis TaxID=3077331 RepID=UPI0037C92A05